MIDLELLLPDTMLNRRDTASALTAAGFPTAEATLATKAVRGGGPPYMKYGRQPLYRWSEVLEWAKGRLSAPASSTSEHRVNAAWPEKLRPLRDARGN